MAPVAELQRPENDPASAAAGRAIYFHTDLFRHFAGKMQGGKIALDLTPEGIATLDLPVLPQGKFEHPWWGELDWTPEVFSEMKRNFQRGVGSAPFLNLDHAGLGLFGSNEAPAAGWPVDLWHDADAGLLMSRNELTDLGEQAFGSRRYRYTSAEVTDEYTDSRGDNHGNVFLGLAGTNRPFHDTMPGAFGQPARRMICLSQRGAYGLWTPGEYLSPEIAAQLGVPGLPRAPQFSIPFSQATDPKEAAMPPDAKTLSLADDGVVVTPEPETDEPELTDPVEEPVSLENPAEPLVLDTGSGEDDGPVTLTRAQLVELQRQAQAGAEANRLLLQAAAENKIGGHVRLGVIPRKKQAAALALALAAPELFDAYFADLPPCLPLSRVGIAGDGMPPADRSGNPHAGGGEPSGGGEETFASMVTALRREHPQMTVSDAMAEVQADHPELYSRHRAETRGQSSRNGRTRG